MSKRAGAEGETPLPRRDPAGAGRSRGRIPTRFNRQNPPSERIATARRARPALPAPQEPQQQEQRPQATRKPQSAQQQQRPQRPQQPREPLQPAAYRIRPGSPDQPPAVQPPAVVQPSRPPTADEWAAVNSRPQAASQSENRAQAQPSPTYAIRPGSPQESRQEPEPDPAAGTSARTAASGAPRRRRRRRLAVTLTTAVVVIGGGTAAGVAALTSGRSYHGTTASAAASATSPGPSAAAGGAPAQRSPAAVDPLVYLSTAAKDTAPLSQDVFFPATIPHTRWTRIAAAATPNCAAAVSPALAADLKAQSCRTVYRATYRSGGTAVTVGVAVFGDSGQAALAKRNARAGNVNPLYAKGTPVFCKAVTCRMTVNALGRYAYFTVAGYTTGKPVPPTDKEALNAGNSAATLVFDDLAARARQAAAARARQAAAAQ